MLAIDRVAVLLLAAGQSRRFGSADKLLAMIDGQPLAAHSAAMLASLPFGGRIAVCASDRDAVASIMEEHGFSVLRMAASGQDMARSLAAGVAAVARLPAIDAILICLADMPFVSADHIGRLIDAHDGGALTVIASSNRDSAMPPALFGRGHFAGLQALEGDGGARAFLKDAIFVYADAIILKDIDRVEDLRG